VNILLLITLCISLWITSQILMRRARDGALSLAGRDMGCAVRSAIRCCAVAIGRIRGPLPLRVSLTVAGATLSWQSRCIAAAVFPPVYARTPLSSLAADRSARQLSVEPVFAAIIFPKRKSAYDFGKPFGASLISLTRLSRRSVSECLSRPRLARSIAQVLKIASAVDTACAQQHDHDEHRVSVPLWFGLVAILAQRDQQQRRIFPRLPCWSSVHLVMHMEGRARIAARLAAEPVALHDFKAQALPTWIAQLL